MYEVHLAQVGLGWVARDARPMTDRDALVRVTFDAETLKETDERLR